MPQHPHGTYLLLEYLGLCVVVDGLCGIRKVLGAILDVNALKDDAGTAGEDEFLGGRKDLSRTVRSDWECWEGWARKRCQ